MVAINQGFGSLTDYSWNPEHVDSHSFMSRKLFAQYCCHPRHSLYHHFRPQWYHSYPPPDVLPFWNCENKCHRLVMRKMVVGGTKIIFQTSCSSDVCQSFNIQEYFKDVTLISDDEKLSKLRTSIHNKWCLSNI